MSASTDPHTGASNSFFLVINSKIPRVIGTTCHHKAKHLRACSTQCLNVCSRILHWKLSMYVCSHNLPAGLHQTGRMKSLFPTNTCVHCCCFISFAYQTLLALHSCFLPEHRITFIVRTQEHKKPLAYPHCPCLHFKYSSGLIQVKCRTPELHHTALKILPRSLGCYRWALSLEESALNYCFHGVFPKYRVHNWLLQIRHTVVRKKWGGSNLYSNRAILVLPFSVLLQPNITAPKGPLLAPPAACQQHQQATVTSSPHCPSHKASTELWHASLAHILESQPLATRDVLVPSAQLLACCFLDSFKMTSAIYNTLHLLQLLPFCYSN